jgi:hypothetical protein
MATKSASVARSIRNTNKLSETDRNLLELLGRFCIRAKHSTWESVNHNNEIEAVMLLREISSEITTHEYQCLTDGWSDYRLHGSDLTLNEAVETITQRLQDHVESF